MSGEQLTKEERDFLKYIEETGVSRLEPFVSPDGVIYRDIESEEHDWKQILFLLKSITKKEYLDEEDFDRAIFCPTCNSPHVYSKYACPTDRSIFVKKVILLQHVTDGYQGEKETFEVEDKLICPQCGDILGLAHDETSHDKNLKTIGFSYECEKNGHKFDRPLVLHYCPDCGALFDYKTAHYVALHAYSLNEKSKQLLRDNLDLELKLAPLVQLLENEDFILSFAVNISGVSGSTHQFDLIALRKDSFIVFDIGLGDPNRMVTLLGKKMDLPGKEAILVEFGGNPELENLGKVYNIPILDLSNEGWEKILRRIISGLDKPPKKNVQRRSLWRR